MGERRRRRDSEALADAGHPSLSAIGLANQGETVMAWDRSTGAPHGAAIVWQDRRAEVICDRLRDHGDFLAHHTGLATRSILRRAEDHLATRAASATGSPSPRPMPGCCTDSAARSPPTWQPPVDRCCSTSTPANGAIGRARSSASIRRRCPGGRQHRSPGRLLGVRRLGAGDRYLRRPAGCAVRRALPHGGRGEVHLRHRAPSCWRAPVTARPGRATDWSVARPGGSANAPPIASTDRCTPSAPPSPG